MHHEHAIETCARLVHDMNRAYCLAHDDTSFLPWEDAPESQRSSVRVVVRAVIAGKTPEQIHNAWLAEKTAAGWVYGPFIDPTATPPTHPFVMLYARLHPAQRAKDALLVDAARAMFTALTSTS